MLKNKVKNTLFKIANNSTSFIRKGKKYLKSNKGEKILKITAISIFMVTIGIRANAAEGTAAIDSMIRWIAAWTLKIGLIVAFIGGIQTALGFKNENADEKVRGLKTLAAGFMVAGISKSLDLFGL